MIRITGKIATFVWFSSLFTSGQEVVLDITDMRDRPIEQVEVGTLFKIKVSIYSDSMSNKQVTIPGLEKACVTVNASSMSMTPSMVVHTYSYHAYMDAVGTYTFGPVTLDSKGNSLVSEAKTLEVVTAQAHKPSSKTKHKDPVFAYLYSDKKVGFVGEPIIFYLEFYTKDPLVELAQVISPALPATLSIKDYGGPEKGTKNIGGTTYTYYRWKWTAVPKEPGEFVIPSYSMSYVLPNHHNAAATAFSVFFGMLSLRETVHSNAAVITVKPLPDYKGKVNALGSFTNVRLELKQVHAKVGQACIAALHLTGAKDDLETVTTPPTLVAMPKELTYYDSEISTAELDASTGVKTFEYIIQPLQAGTVTIPEQIFTFFDPTKSAYISLSTKPCTLTIEQAEAQSITLSEDKESQNVDDHHVSMPILVDMPSSLCAYWFIPWPLFWLSMLVPLFVVLLLYVWSMFVPLYGKRKRKKVYDDAFSSAHERLYEAEKREAYDDIYAIFMYLFSVRFAQDKPLITDDMINNLWSDQPSLQDEWSSFWQQCTAYVFVTQPKTGNQVLWQQAHDWITLLEKRI